MGFLAAICYCVAFWLLAENKIKYRTPYAFLAVIVSLVIAIVLHWQWSSGVQNPSGSDTSHHPGRKEAEKTPPSLPGSVDQKAGSCGVNINGSSNKVGDVCKDSNIPKNK